MEAYNIAKRKTGPDGCHPTALDPLTAVCSSTVTGGPGPGEEGFTPEAIPKPSCTPWTYDNIYRCSPPPSCCQLAAPCHIRLPLVSGAPVFVFLGCHDMDEWRCRHSWPEAARVLQKAVEDSKKLKRRGTPNVVVFAGMTLPPPFTFPVLITQRHVSFLHAVLASFPAPAPPNAAAVGGEAKAEDGVLPPLPLHWR